LDVFDRFRMTEWQIDMPTIAIAGAVLLAILCIVLIKNRREKFASERAHEVFNASQDLFTKTAGKANYSEYKTAVPGPVDAVQYSDVRNLWRQGKMTAETVQNVL